MISVKYIVMFLTAMFLISCQKVKIVEESAVVRVGTTALTEKEIIATLGNSASPEEILDYIRRWSDRELMYQAAVSMGLGNDETVKMTIENMKKEFLSALYIQQEAAKAEFTTVSLDEIENKYLENPQLYTRKEPVIKAVKMVLPTLSDAWKVREGLTPDGFQARGANVSLERIPNFEDVKFELKSNFTQEIWNTIFNTRVTGITSPLSENGKFSIYLILEKENVGAVLPLAEASELIKRELFASKNGKIVKDACDLLRNRHDYSYNNEYIAKLENLRKDTTTDNKQ
ncbi:MAG: peptidyl-prolyl cis-trans isomerase [Chitinispirillales bacterium]|nr:peptidyl-prolyl cis-trans isomerase [Chitinispirillales bacterium]